MIFPLPFAEKLATKIAAELTPFCEKIEIAGSIRRRRPLVGDIDLVVLPKAGQLEALRERCKRNAKVITDGNQNLIVELSITAWSSLATSPIGSRFWFFDLKCNSPAPSRSRKRSTSSASAPSSARAWAGGNRPDPKPTPKPTPPAVEKPAPTPTPATGATTSLPEWKRDLDALFSEARTADSWQQGSLRKRALEAIAVPPAARGKLRLGKSTRNAAVMETARKGAEAVEQLVHPDLIQRTRIEVHTTRGGRAFHRNGQIHLTTMARSRPPPTRSCTASSCKIPTCSIPPGRSCSSAPPARSPSA